MGEHQETEILERVLNRSALLTALAGDPQEWSALLDTVEAARQTLSQTLSEFEHAGLVQQTDDGYTLTGAGQLLVGSFQTTLANTLTAEERTLVESRQDLLDVLQSGPVHKPDLVEETDNSRSTVDRAIDNLDDAGLITRETRGWVTTDRGNTACQCFREFVTDLRTILEARDILEPLPADCSLPLTVLSDNEVTVRAEKYQLIERIAERIKTADQYRALLPRIEDSRHIRLFHSLVTRGGGQMELLAPSDVLVYLREEFPHLSHELGREDSFQASQCDRPPFGLLLLEHSGETAHAPTTDTGAQQVTGDAETSALIVVYDSDGISGFVDIDADAAAAVRWVREYYESVREESDPTTDELVAASTDIELPWITNRRLPAQVRTAGFVRIDEAYLDQREPLPPATAWRAGLGFPEIDAGYAVSRPHDDEQSMTDHLFERLSAGDDIAVLGQPGSGKSTIIQRTAYRWFDENDGVVLYQESGQSPAFDSPAALETFLARIDEPTLVVVEDAVRAEINSIFEVAQSYSGDETVTFLFDARKTEWHDPKAFPTDARLAAFRQNHFETVTLSGLSADDCERILDHVETTTGRSVGIDSTELFTTVQDETHGGTQTATTPGLVFLLFHRLSRYIEPLADREETTPPTALTEHVASVREDLEALGEHALDVGIVAHACNAAGIDIDPAYLYTPLLDDENATETVSAALDRLEGDVLFELSDSTGYQATHETWSVEFLVDYLDAAGESAASTRFGKCLSRVLRLAVDTASRDQIRRTAGQTQALAELVVDPGAWTTQTVEQLFTLGRERPKLAPLFDAGGESSIDVPSVCADATQTAIPVWLGKMLMESGKYDRSKRAFEQLPEDDPDLKVKRLLGRGEVAYLRGNYDAACPLLEACIDRASEETQTKQVAAASAKLGYIANRQGNHRQARNYYERSLDLYEAIENATGKAISYTGLGLVAQNQGEYDTAREYHERALEIREESGNRHGVAKSLNNLGMLMGNQGQYEQARSYYTRSLDIKREIGDRQNEATTLNNLGLIAYDRGNYERASEYHERAFEIRAEIGDRLGTASSLNSRGRVAAKLGDFETATEYYERALPIFREIGDRHREATTLGFLGEVLQKQGQLATAREHYEDSLSILQEIDAPRGESNCLTRLGTLATVTQNYTKAREYHERALDIRQEIGNNRGETASRINLAEIARHNGDYEQAAQYLTDSETVHDNETVVEQRKRQLERVRLALARDDIDTARETLTAAAETIAESESHAYGRLKRLTGRVEAAAGAPADARKHWQAALEIFTSIGTPHDGLVTVRYLIELSHDRGEHEQATQWKQRAETLLETAPTPVTNVHRDWVSQPIELIEAS